MSAAPAGDGGAVERMLEAAGFPPAQIPELAARIREDVRRAPPPTPELLAQLAVLLDLSGEVRRGAA